MIEPTNGRVEYGKLIEKVDIIQKTLDEQKGDIKCLFNDLEKRIRIIEDWKNNLSGKIYIFLTFAIIIVEIIMDKAINLF